MHEGDKQNKLNKSYDSIKPDRMPFSNRMIKDSSLTNDRMDVNADNRAGHVSAEKQRREDSRMNQNLTYDNHDRGHKQISDLNQNMEYDTSMKVHELTNTPVNPKKPDSTHRYHSSLGVHQPNFDSRLQTIDRSSNVEKLDSINDRV